MARLEMPGLLVEACDGDEALLEWVGELRESWQRWIGKNILEPQSDEAKERRAESWAEKLLMTMEAEKDLPPGLSARLKRTRYAADGWEKMSVSRRRDFLITIFGAKGLEARENRIVFWLEACVAKGKKG